MRLAQFILGNIGPILEEWEQFASTLPPGATMTRKALREDAKSILLACARIMQVDQTLDDQISKAKGRGGADNVESNRLDNVSHRHGEDRVVAAFDIMEVASEYRALRASVLRLWRASLPEPAAEDIDDITRFNESIDQSLAQAICSYTKRVDRSRQLFLAILGHDLRNPLNCIRMGMNLTLRTDPNPDSSETLSMVSKETDAMEHLIQDLIDFASTNLDGIMPLNRTPVDLKKLCPEVVDEFRRTYPARTLHFQPRGDITGFWDEARMRQVLSNLLGNALQHGSPEGPVELSAVSDGSGVVLSVHNDGEPIPSSVLPTLFDPLVRHDGNGESALNRTPGSVGLGLYIVREIVKAKGGNVQVTSTAQQGTTFTIRLPRQPTVVVDNLSKVRVRSPEHSI